jgi:hypothetical protein
MIRIPFTISAMTNKERNVPENAHNTGFVQVGLKE